MFWPFPFPRRKRLALPSVRQHLHAADWLLQVCLAGARVQTAFGYADGAEALRALRRLYALLGVEPPAAPAASGRHFITDVLFLYRAREYIRRHQGDAGGTFREVFHYVTGPELADNTFVLSDVVPVRFAEQTAVRVRVEDGSNISALAALDQLRMSLHGHMHSHPGRGPGATHPSATDRRFQDRLERGNYHTCGAIFDASGEFVRFWGPDAFTVQIQGNIEEVEHHVYRLAVADRNLSFTNSTLDASGGGGGSG
jgi:hypothetical protein